VVTPHPALLRDLDELDTDERELRHRRLAEWRELRVERIERARRVLEDASSSPAERDEAKILIGAYAIDPVVMLAGDAAYHGSQAFGGPPGNRHARTPLPPRPTFFARLRQSIRRRKKRGSSSVQQA
jgi:hypothetical protein